jgi:hypothetical protein
MAVLMLAFKPGFSSGVVGLDLAVTKISQPGHSLVGEALAANGNFDGLRRNAEGKG